MGIGRRGSPPVAEMFMANEPLKRADGKTFAAGISRVAEMFMANEPLKQQKNGATAGHRIKLQRCLWRMSH